MFVPQLTKWLCVQLLPQGLPVTLDKSLSPFGDSTSISKGRGWNSGIPLSSPWKWPGPECWGPEWAGWIPGHAGIPAGFSIPQLGPVTPCRVGPAWSRIIEFQPGSLQALCSVPTLSPELKQTSWCWLCSLLVSGFGPLGGAGHFCPSRSLFRECLGLDRTGLHHKGSTY